LLDWNLLQIELMYKLLEHKVLDSLHFRMTHTRMLDS